MVGAALKAVSAGLIGRVRANVLIALKAVDIAGRAAFTVGVTYLLPLSDSGRFGIVILLVSLFAYYPTWDRHIDIQREAAGRPPDVLDSWVRQAFRFYAFNQFYSVPVLFIAGYYWAGLEPLLALAICLVAIADTYANQFYNYALVDRRYLPIMWVATIKNAALGLVIPFFWITGRAIAIEPMILAWLAASLAGLLLTIVIWRSISLLPADTAQQHSLMKQFRRSFFHFMIGLFNVVSLQLDRIIISALLPLASVGIYFRHALIVSLVYQLFNISSFNRILPRIFAMVRTERLSALMAIVNREWLRAAALAIIGLAVGIVVDRLTGQVFTRQFSIEPLLASVLVAGALIRVGADFRTMILNSHRRERAIFRRQVIVYCISAPIVAALTLLFGPMGTAIGTAVLAVVLFALMRGAVSQLPEKAHTA